MIHNENNMRPGEINGLFKVSGLGDVCSKLSDKRPMLDIFGESEPGKAHGQLLAGMEDFFERRNAIAHALNPGQSSGPDQIINDIDMLESFGKALCETLNTLAPKSLNTQKENETIVVNRSKDKLEAVPAKPAGQQETFIERIRSLLK